MPKRFVIILVECLRLTVLFLDHFLQSKKNSFIKNLISSLFFFYLIRLFCSSWISVDLVEVEHLQIGRFFPSKVLLHVLIWRDPNFNSFNFQSKVEAAVDGGFCIKSTEKRNLIISLQRSHDKWTLFWKSRKNKLFVQSTTCRSKRKTAPANSWMMDNILATAFSDTKEFSETLLSVPAGLKPPR